MPTGIERAPAGAGASRTGPVRGPQALVAGLTLMALGAFAIWLVSDLSQGTLRSMGPAMLPRWLAIGVALCGAALVAASFMKDGEPLDSAGLRGPIFVVAGVLAFAATIRGVGLGPVSIPGLGLIVAGPLAIFIGGYASPEVRPRELLILALALTAFCMVLFGDLLNLPIPLFPQWFADLYPAGWTNDGRLRMTAGLLLAGALAVHAAGNPGFYAGLLRPEPYRRGLASGLASLRAAVSFLVAPRTLLWMLAGGAAGLLFAWLFPPTITVTPITALDPTGAVGYGQAIWSHRMVGALVGVVAGLFLALLYVSWMLWPILACAAAFVVVRALLFWPGLDPRGTVPFSDFLDQLAQPFVRDILLRALASSGLIGAIVGFMGAIVYAKLDAPDPHQPSEPTRLDVADHSSAPAHRGSA